MALVDDIKALIELLDDPEWVSMHWEKKIFAIAPQILKAVCLIIEGMDADEVDAFAPQLVETAEYLFDEYIEPIDIPTLNPFWERLIDASIRRNIGPAIYSFIESRNP